MIILLLMAAAGVPTAAPAMPDAPGACAWGMKQADRDRRPARVRKLGEMPPADQVLTVYRTENGCPKPVVVRRDIGAK